MTIDLVTCEYDGIRLHFIDHSYSLCQALDLVCQVIDIVCPFLLALVCSRESQLGIGYLDDYIGFVSTAQYKKS